MSGVAFTRGPWELSWEGAGKRTLRVRAAAAPQVSIATVHALDEREANGHLINAATDLYEAGDAFVTAWMCDCKDARLPGFAIKLRAALAKARGES